MPHDPSLPQADLQSQFNRDARSAGRQLWRAEKVAGEEHTLDEARTLHDFYKKAGLDDYQNFLDLSKNLDLYHKFTRFGGDLDSFLKIHSSGGEKDADAEVAAPAVDADLANATSRPAPASTRKPSGKLASKFGKGGRKRGKLAASADAAKSSPPSSRKSVRVGASADAAKSASTAATKRSNSNPAKVPKTKKPKISNPGPTKSDAKSRQVSLTTGPANPPKSPKSKKPNTSKPGPTKSAAKSDKPAGSHKGKKKGRAARELGQAGATLSSGTEVPVKVCAGSVFCFSEWGSHRNPLKVVSLTISVTVVFCVSFSFVQNGP